jgi:hypothetical protein
VLYDRTACTTLSISSSSGHRCNTGLVSVASRATAGSRSTASFGPSEQAAGSVIPTKGVIFTELVAQTFYGQSCGNACCQARGCTNDFWSRRSVTRRPVDACETQCTLGPWLEPQTSCQIRQSQHVLDLTQHNPLVFCVPIFVCSQCLRRKPCYLPGSGHYLTQHNPHHNQVV